jgi:hypothetical protein
VREEQDHQPLVEPQQKQRIPSQGVRLDKNATWRPTKLMYATEKREYGPPPRPQQGVTGPPRSENNTKQITREKYEKDEDIYPSSARPRLARIPHRQGKGTLPRKLYQANSEEEQEFLSVNSSDTTEVMHKDRKKPPNMQSPARTQVPKAATQ